MSMRDYCVHDFGYVFSLEMIDELIEKLEPKDIGPEDTYDMADYMGLEYISEFTGEAVHRDENGADDYSDTQFYSCEPIFYLPIERYSSLFKAAYQSKEELAQSMKNRYPKWLPDDLDVIYESIRHIVGTSFG